LKWYICRPELFYFFYYKLLLIADDKYIWIEFRFVNGTKLNQIKQKKFHGDHKAVFEYYSSLKITAFKFQKFNRKHLEIHDFKIFI